MDLGLPDMDGWEALSEIRADRARPRSCASSRSPPTPWSATANVRSPAGFDGYLSKPIDFATFADSVAELPAVSRERPLILAVDDEPANLALLRKLLTRQGYDVVEAADGPSALGAVAEHDPTSSAST